jgi:hypothetical protein
VRVVPDAEDYRKAFVDARRAAADRYKTMELVHLRAMVQMATGAERKKAVARLTEASKDFKGWPAVYARLNKSGWVDRQVKYEIERLRTTTPARTGGAYAKE